MIPRQYDNLISKLEKHTREGNISWELSSNDFSVHTFIRDRIIELRKVSSTMIEGKDWDSKISFALRNDDGNTIDTFACKDTENCWETVNVLYGEARRQAKDIDEEVESLENELDSLDNNSNN